MRNVKHILNLRLSLISGSLFSATRCRGIFIHPETKKEEKNARDEKLLLYQLANSSLGFCYYLLISKFINARGQFGSQYLAFNVPVGVSAGYIRIFMFRIRVACFKFELRYFVLVYLFYFIFFLYYLFTGTA